MRWPLCLILIAGCDGIFEENPVFGTDTDTATTTATSGEASVTTDSAGSATSGGTTAASMTGTPDSTDTSAVTTAAESSSTETGDVPMDCGVDMFEPNDDQGDSYILGSLTTGEGAFNPDAQIDDTADEDWYKVNIDQVGAAVPTPSARVTAPQDAEVCIIVRCSDGAVAVDCGEATPIEVGGSSGCCATNEVSFAYDCAGAVESDGSINVRVRASAPVQQCVPYRLRVSAVAE